MAESKQVPSQATDSGSKPAMDVPPHMAPGDRAPPGAPGAGEQLCPKCQGTGSVDGRPCPDCEGSGWITVGVGGA